MYPQLVILLLMANVKIPQHYTVLVDAVLLSRPLSQGPVAVLSVLTQPSFYIFLFADVRTTGRQVACGGTNRTLSLDQPW